MLIEGVAADVDARAAGRGRRARRPARPRSPTDRTAAASRRARRRSASSRPRSTDTGVRWLAEVGVGTVHVAADSEAALAAARAAAARHGGWLLREAGAPGLDGFGRAAAEPRRHAADPRRVRSRRASSTRAGCRSASTTVEVDGQVDGETAMYDAPVDVQHRKPPSRARGRRGRAGRVRRVRALPAALPDLPRHRPRGRVAARAHRRDARGRARRRADRRRVPAHDGDVRAVPRLRGRVPVGGAVRPPDGGHRASRCAHAATAPRGAVAARRRVARVRRRAAASLAAARAHVAALARAAPAPRAATVRLAAALAAVAARRRSTGAGPTRRVPVHRVRHGRVAARRPPRRAHRDARRGRAPGSPGTRRRLLRRAARPRRAGAPRRAGSRGASSRRCRATRPSSSTARAAARR